MNSEQIRDTLFLMGSRYELEGTDEKTIEYLKELEQMGCVKIIDGVAYKTDRGRRTLENVIRELG